MAFTYDLITKTSARDMRKAGYRHLQAIGATTFAAHPESLQKQIRLFSTSGLFNDIRVTREGKAFHLWGRLTAQGERVETAWQRRRLLDWLRGISRDIDEVLLLSHADARSLGLEASLHNIRCIVDACLGQASPKGGR